ncbi:MAG: hypothetical protein ACK5ML_06075 [Lachnospiraceae bacterium]
MAHDTETKTDIKNMIRAERSKLKGMKLRDKIDYIWTYYKAPILGVLIALILCVSLIQGLLRTEPDVVLNVLAINADPYYDAEQDDTFDTFLTEQDLDPELNTISFNTSILISFTEEGMVSNPQILQVMVTLLMAGDIDMVTADEQMYQYIAEQGYMMPLSSYMSESEIAALDDRILYAVDPETGQEEAFGVLADANSGMTKGSLYESPPYAGLVYNAENMTVGTEFIEYITN